MWRNGFTQATPCPPQPATQRRMSAADCMSSPCAVMPMRRRSFMRCVCHRCVAGWRSESPTISPKRWRMWRWWKCFARLTAFSPAIPFKDGSEPSHGIVRSIRCAMNHAAGHASRFIGRMRRCMSPMAARPRHVWTGWLQPLLPCLQASASCWNFTTSKDEPARPSPRHMGARAVPSR